MNLEIGKTIEVTAHEVDRFAQGVSRIEDVVVFTHGLLASEKALVTITQVKKNFVKAKIKKLLTQSPLRKTMPSRLGALDLFHLKDEEQDKWQYETTKEQVKRNLGLEDVVEATLSDENKLRYRNKVVYHVLNDSMLRLGLYTQEPIELVEVHTFLMNSLAIQRCIAKIQQQSIEIDPEVFKHVVLRSNEKEEVLVTLIAYKKEFKGLKQLIDVIKTFKEVVGLTLNIKPNETTILGRESILLFGKNELEFTLGELKLKVNDQSFMQVNTSMMIKVYDEIKKEVEGETLIDAYSGIGSIGFYVGSNAKKVIMIENNLKNIEVANELKHKVKGNYEVIYGDAKNFIPKFNADTLVVDPPRAGLHESLLTTLKEKQFKKIIYLSCELNTLIRDLKVLTETYKIKRIVPVRMFPQTTAIETLTILERKN